MSVTRFDPLRTICMEKPHQSVGDEAAYNRHQIV